MNEKKEEKGRTVSLWLDKDLVERLDKLAKKGGITRSKLLANMIELSAKSLERADAVGILSLSLLIRDFEYNLKTWIREIRANGAEIKGYWDNGELDADDADLTAELAWK